MIILETGAYDNSEESIENSLKCWKKAVRKYTQYNSEPKEFIQKIRSLVEKNKQKKPESHLLTLLKFLLQPDTDPASLSAYSYEALKAIQSLPQQIKEKVKYHLIVNFIGLHLANTGIYNKCRS